MATYSFAGQVLDEGDPRFEHLAALAHGRRLRPLCLCRSPGLPMYVARCEQRYLLKRMPDTGGAHAYGCPSYSPPAALSGLQASAGAIRVEDDGIGLRLDFALERRPGRAVGVPDGEPAPQVRGAAARLSLRALLHYLWGEAGLQRWPRPRWQWPAVRAHLLAAADGKRAGAHALAERLYLPEPYTPAEHAALAARSAALFARTLRQGKVQPLLLLVGEVKELGEGRYGNRLMIKHAPHCPFLLPEPVARRLRRRFADVLELWGASGDCRLMVAATFGGNGAGQPVVEAAALMLCGWNWLPFESLAGRALLDRLVAEARRFELCLRYDMPYQKVLPLALLCDTTVPTALYLQPPPDDTGGCPALMVAGGELPPAEAGPGAARDGNAGRR